MDPDDLNSREPGPDQQFEQTRGEDRLWHLIRTHLEPLEQDAIQLRCVEGLPVDSITAILRVEDRSGARGLLQRARRKLRAAMGTNDESAGGAS